MPMVAGGREWLAFVGGATVLCACAQLIGIDKTYVETDAGDAGDGGDADAGDANVFTCPTVDASTGYVFCDDFDHTPLGASWSAVNADNGAVGLDTSNPVSAPNAFASSIDATDAAVQRQAKLSRSFVAAKAVDCRFSVQVVQPGTDLMRFFSIDVVNPALAAYELNIYIDPKTTPYVQEWAGMPDGGGYYSATNFTSLFTPGTWVDVELSIEYGKTIQVWIDGNLTLTMSSLAQVPQGEVFILGAFSNTGTTAWKLLFDDVACVVTL